MFGFWFSGPSPWRGGGVDATLPPEVVLRCTPNHEADRAEILHSLWGIPCATFSKKKIWPGHARSRSYDVTRGTRSGHFLREIPEYDTLEGDIEASFDYFRSGLTFMTPPPYPLTFWSRSGQSQGQGQASDLGWPYDKFMCCSCLYGFLEVMNSYLLFIWDTVASFLRQCKQQRAPKVASSRPASIDAARRTWPGGLPGVTQQQEPYKSNKLRSKTCRDISAPLPASNTVKGRANFFESRQKKKITRNWNRHQ